MSIQLCHPYAWEDPRYIFKAWSSEGKCVSELVNRIIVVYVVFILFGWILSSVVDSALILCGIFATLVLIPTFVLLKNVTNKGFDVSGVESFQGFSQEEPKPSLSLSSSSSTGNPEPTASASAIRKRNPFNNILIDEYKYAPTRDAAPDITTANSKVELDSMFRTQWYNDPTDVFGKTQGQRMFLTQPITTIPNDQDSYQKWLYKIPGKTCKEGNPDACYGGTEGATVPWLNN
jgi:hypothetical protein